MKLPGLITVSPDQTDLLKETADMMGESFMEENWFITWLSALDAINTPYERKLELIRAVFLDDLSVHAPYQGVYVLEDKSAACGGYLYSDLQGHTHSELDTKAGKHFYQLLPKKNLICCNSKMPRCKQFLILIGHAFMLKKRITFTSLPGRLIKTLVAPMP